MAVVKKDTLENGNFEKEKPGKFSSDKKNKKENIYEKGNAAKEQF